MLSSVLQLVRGKGPTLSSATGSKGQGVRGIPPLPTLSYDKPVVRTTLPRIQLQSWLTLTSTNQAGGGSIVSPREGAGPDLHSPSVAAGVGQKELPRPAPSPASGVDGWWWGSYSFPCPCHQTTG